MAATDGTTTSVASSATSVLLLASSVSRHAGPGAISAIIANNSTAILYVLLGTGTASATNFTYAVAGNASGVVCLEVPDYKGAIQGMWASANGSAYVTELL